MADYQEQVVALDVALDRKRIVDPGQPVDSLYINGRIPVGITVKVHFGDRAGVALGDYASVQLCPAEDRGVFLTTSPAAPSQSLSLIIGSGISVGAAQ